MEVQFVHYAAFFLQPGLVAKGICLWQCFRCHFASQSLSLHSEILFSHAFPGYLVGIDATPSIRLKVLAMLVKAHGCAAAMLPLTYLCTIYHKPKGYFSLRAVRGALDRASAQSSALWRHLWERR